MLELRALPADPALRRLVAGHPVLHRVPRRPGAGPMPALGRRRGRRPDRGPPRPVSSAPGLWERAADDKRPDNPYLFLKSPSVVVGANDDVVIPKGREQIDWECEFAVVVGTPAKNVTTAEASKYIFGYTIEFDVSDRGGRNDRKMGGGPDWFVQKNHDTFGPLGPFIVPKEFLPNPTNTRHYFTLNGEMKQDANTSQMEYNLYEMLAYASNVLTLNAGDVLSLGSTLGHQHRRSERAALDARRRCGRVRRRGRRRAAATTSSAQKVARKEAAGQASARPDSAFSACRRSPRSGGGGGRSRAETGTANTARHREQRHDRRLGDADAQARADQYRCDQRPEAPNALGPADTDQPRRESG